MLDSEIYNCITVQFSKLSELCCCLFSGVLGFLGIGGVDRGATWFHTNDRHLQRELGISGVNGMLGIPTHSCRLQSSTGDEIVSWPRIWRLKSLKSFPWRGLL